MEEEKRPQELTAEEKKAQELLEEKDSESRIRTYSGPMGTLLTILLCTWAVFQIYFTTFGVMSAVNLRAFHCAFLLCFTFLLYPTYKKEKRLRRLPPVWDMFLIAATVFTFGYLILNYTRIARIGGRVNQFEIVLAAVGLLLAFEAARRASGNLAVLALIFLAYNWFGKYIPGKLGHNGFSLKRVLTAQFWGTQGILGTGIGVSATYIFLFVVFGAFLKYSGFSFCR